MNLTYLFINIIFCLLIAYCQDNLEKKSLIFIGQLHFMENERYIFQKNVLTIPFSDEEEILRKLQNRSSVKLIEKQTEFKQAFDNNSTFLTFQNDQGNYIDICVLQHQKIDCKIRINNTLYNEGIIVNEINTSSISLPSDNCFSAIFINDNSFLIQCQILIHQLQYFIINKKSQIIDQIKIDLPPNCRFHSRLQFNFVLIGTLDCSIPHTLIIEINDKDQNVQFNHNLTKLHELNNYPQQYNLMDLKICDRDNILLIFTNTTFLFNMKNKEFSIQVSIFQQWNNYFKNTCFPYQNKGYYDVLINPGRYMTVLDIITERESQIKNILSNDDFFILLLQDEVVLIYAYYFQQSILNARQIQKLNTLPFFVMLDNSNKISFHKIVCSNRILKYEHQPYVAVYQIPTISSIKNSEILYHQTSQYSISYPLMELTKKSIAITQKEIVKNSFKIDFLNIFQSIPFYLEQEEDLDKILYEFKNESIITYHLKLQFRKILKIISFKINNLIIIYEDNHHKLFMNLQNDMQTKNVYIMSTTSEVSVEYIEEIDINCFTILFIMSDKVTLLKIQDQNDILFNKTTIFNQRIKEYKIELDNIIFLLIDNTVIGYQQGYWYDYYQAQKKEKQQFWKMNKHNKFNDYRVPQIFINHENSEIEVKSLMQDKYSVVVSAKGKIIHSIIMVPQSRIVLFVQNQENVQLYLYYFDVQEIYLLYQMPTYEFEILVPLQISVFNKLLGVITIRNDQKYLLVYDVNKQGKYCLIQINRMYPDFKQFNLIDITGIFSQILIDKIVINYPTYHFKINIQERHDKPQCKIQIKLQAKSFIESIPSEFIIFLDILNDDNKLRYRKTVTDSILWVFSQNEYINLDPIFGSVNNMSLSKNCDGSLMEPIQVVSSISLQNCRQIIQQFCFYSENQLSQDYFTLKKNITFQSDSILLNQYLTPYQSTTILYSKQTSQIILFDSSQIQSNQQFLNNNQNIILVQMDLVSQGIQSISLKNKFFILITRSFYTIYKEIQIGTGIAYKIDCTTSYQYIIQAEHICDILFSHIFIILDNDFGLNLQFCHKSIDQTFTKFQVNLSFQIVGFYVLHSEFQNNSKFLLNVILFCSTNTAYIYHFDFEIQTDKFILIQQQTKQQLRYLNIFYQRFQKINDNIFMLYGKDEQSIESIYLYKIDQNSSNELIDYFYKSDLDLQIYNATHFVHIQNNTNQIIAQLIQINNYQVFLQDKCEINLNNDVSSLNTIIVLEQNAHKNSSNTYQLIIILNLLFILLLIAKNKQR